MLSHSEHGTRRSYRGGCGCLRCRAANSAYHSALRQAKARGDRLPGQRVCAKPLWKCIKALQVEGFSLALIAKKLGLRCPQLQLHHDQVTQKNFDRVRKLYQAIMLEGPEA